jgi:hypothetical protein
MRFSKPWCDTVSDPLASLIPISAAHVQVSNMKLNPLGQTEQNGFERLCVIVSDVEGCEIWSTDVTLDSAGTVIHD